MPSFSTTTLERDCFDLARLIYLQAGRYERQASPGNLGFDCVFPFRLAPFGSVCSRHIGGQSVVGAVGADQVMANAACRGPVAVVACRINPKGG
jgi:hypothetical protein